MSEARYRDFLMELENAHNSGFCEGCEGCGACFTHDQDCTCTKDEDTMGPIELRKLTTHLEGLSKENARLQAENDQLRQDSGGWIVERRSLKITVHEIQKKLDRANQSIRGLQSALKHSKQELSRVVNEKELFKATLVHIADCPKELVTDLRRIAKKAIDHWKAN